MADTTFEQRTTAAPPKRVDVALAPERIVRLAAPSAAEAADAFVLTPGGRTDFTGLAMLRRIADELGRADRAEARALFADGMPSAVVAAFAHGLARAEAEAGRRVMLIDLGDTPEHFDAAFEQATPTPRSRRRRLDSGFDVRVDEHGVEWARPIDPDGDPATTTDGDRLAEFVAAVLYDRDRVLLHLGADPTVATLLDAAEAADHVVLVADAADFADRHRSRDIDLLCRVVPRFDRVLALTLAAEPDARRDDRRRSHR